MIHQDKTQNLVTESTYLCLAIDKLLDKQTKSWGCFQAKKEADFSTHRSFSSQILLMFSSKVINQISSQLTGAERLEV